MIQKWKPLHLILIHNHIHNSHHMHADCSARDFCLDRAPYQTVSWLVEFFIILKITWLWRFYVKWSKPRTCVHPCTPPPDPLISCQALISPANQLLFNFQYYSNFKFKIYQNLSCVVQIFFHNIEYWLNNWAVLSCFCPVGRSFFSIIP